MLVLTGLWCCSLTQYNSDDYQKHIKHMFYREPCVYGHRILSHAASIFAAVRNMPVPPCYHDDPPADAVDRQASSQLLRRQSTLQRMQPTFNFQSRAEKRLSFKLVFQTLKCENLSFLLIFNIFVMVAEQNTKHLFRPTIPATGRHDKMFGWR